MFWSTEDHHRQQQHNYYNLQSVQHQNGLQQATAAVSPHQQQHVIQPPSIQQQPQQQPQQHRPAQQIHQTHFANQQQFQQQQQQQHHQRWAQRPGPILTIPPFLQQYPNNVSNSTQFCAPPQNYYQSTQQYPQASAVSAAPQQRQCLPQGCTVYTMPPPASALRQNITQPPPNIMTPTTSATPQQMQMQYFSTQQFCQPPPLGQQTYAHVLTPTLPETQIVKPRKHAIPIIDPITYENIMERKSRSNESPNTDDASSIRTTPSSTSIDESKETENDVKKEDQAKDELPQQENKIEEEMTSASSPGVLDHVESIAPEDEAVEEEVEVEIVESKIPSEEMYKQINQELSCSSFSSTIPIIEDDKQAEKINRGDNDEAISHIEGNLAHSVIESEEMLSSIDPKEKSLSIHPEEKPLSNETTEKPESSPKAVVANTKAGKQSKKQQTQQSPPTTKPMNKKAKRNSKRLKESQKKQKADLIKSENNNTNKATNQNENNKAKQTDKLSDPSNLTNRLKTKAKELSRSNSSTITEEITTPPDDFEGESSIAVSPTTTSLDTYEKSEENSLQVDDSAETLTYDENDHSSSLQLNDNFRLSKSVEIASKILEIEPTDDNSLLFLNSSVSGYEEDISPSPTYFSREEDDKVEDILFGDFSQTENFQQEISSEEISNKETTLLKDLDQKNEEDNHASLINDEFKEKKYTLQELKSLAAEPASKIPPSFRGQICQIIGKNPRDGPSVPHQHNQIYQPMSYKESINFNRKRNRKLTDSPHQQFQQQQILDNNQQQQQQQRNNPDIIRVYLSLNEDIQLAESKNAWVPPILKDFGPKAAEDDEQILKKIRGILNKLTPENFDKLLQTASIFPMNTVERINKVMLLIFEKTISEPNFAPTYARFCKFLFNPEDSNHTMFKYNLIKRIQDEFEANVNNAEAKAAKLKPLMEKLTAVNNSKEKQEIKAELDDQEYQFRRRAWGTVRFIAEMCKIGFIRIDTVCNCVEGLLDVRCEEKLEYMCKLLTTVGHQLEIAGRKPKNSNGYDIKQRLDKIFDKIRQVVEKKNGAGQKISSRVRFMMQDIIELRARSWDHKDTTTVVPSREASPAMKRDPPSSQQHRGTRNFLPSMTGGYDRKRQHGNEAQQKTTSIDRNKLSFNLSISNSADIKLGNSSPLMWQVAKRSQQQQTAQITLPTTPPEQQDLSNDECERLITALIEIVSEGEPSELFAKWITIDKHHHECIVNHVLNEQLYSEKGKRRELVHYPQLFTSLMKEKLISKQTFIEAYLKFNEIIEDAVQMDVPLGWDNLFKLIGPLLHFELVPFDAIWNQKWFNKECGNKFVISLIKYFTSQFGAYYMRYFWDNNSLQWTNFLSEDKIQSFINGNRFRFIDDSTNCAPPLFIQRSAEELVQRIKELLAQCDQNIDVIIDFINTNVVIDCNFVRSLTMFLCDYTVIYIPNQTSSNNTNKIKSSDSSTASTSSSFKLQRDKFIKKCIPLLRLCLDSSDERELSCLHAIVASGNRLGCHKFPIDLISSILVELYGEVISKESFEKWREELSSLEGDISKELDAFFKTLPI